MQNDLAAETWVAAVLFCTGLVTIFFVAAVSEVKA